MALAATPVAVRGERLILYLLLALSVATLVALLVLASFAEPVYRLRVYIALAGNIWLAGMVLIILSMIGHQRRKGEAR